jgi:DNA polymerase-3 subunit epsilon
MPFADRIAFVDVETTGGSPLAARITEVGVVSVLAGAPGEPPRVEEWSSLVNPGVPIPPEIRFLTGITDAMVAAAPAFEEIAPELLARLQGAVFVAHHARFDYGFVKQSFARAGIDFHARTLCTVRLSRLLYPDRTGHSLDAITLRHGLPVAGRHRALGDARVLWAFVQALYRRWSRPEIEAAVRRLLRHPNLPAHLPEGTLESLPNAPGVYTFLGPNEHPLYIGSSTNLRQRVAAHFCGDHTSERGLRLASETHRVDWHETAGAFGARLLEATWIRERLPAHNVAQRRRSGGVFVAIDPLTARPAYLPQESVDVGQPALHGPFASRATARRALLEAASAHDLCLKAMRLERGRTGEPCFRRQLGRCRGACLGEEAAEALALRALEAIAPWRMPAWPFDGAVALVEGAPLRFREDWHVFFRWRHLGTVANEGAALELAARARHEGTPPFDAPVFALLRGRLRERATSGGPVSLVERIVALGAGAEPNPVAGLLRDN